MNLDKEFFGDLYEKERKEFRVSVDAQRLALEGDLDGSQAIIFIDDAIERADGNDFAKMRLQWLRAYVLRMVDTMVPRPDPICDNDE